MGQFYSLPISRITVKREERQRSTIDTDNLKDSIARRGLINPITVQVLPPPGFKDEDFELEWLNDPSIVILLRAGERRLTACRELKHEFILCRFMHSLTSIEYSIIELEENLRRKDMEWADTARAIQRIHSLYRELDNEWTQGETANAIGLSLPHVNHYLTVAGELHHERVASAGTLREAQNVVERQRARSNKSSLENLLGIKVTEPPKPSLDPSNTILQLDFLSWLQAYQGPKFNFLHCDFPYGIQVFDGPQGQGSSPDLYEDHPDIYFSLLEALCHNINKIMSLSGHLMFWFSQRHLNKTLELFDTLCKPKFKFCQFPLIWLKSDNHGISPDPRRLPRHIYETCLFGYRGDRQVVQVTSDAYSCHTNSSLHPHTKPEAMLRHFFSMLVDEHTLFLDPTCGSGSSLRAADSLGAKYILGLEKEPTFCETARKELNKHWVLKAAQQKVASQQKVVSK